MVSQRLTLKEAEVSEVSSLDSDRGLTWLMKWLGEKLAKVKAEDPVDKSLEDLSLNVAKGLIQVGLKKL